MQRRYVHGPGIDNPIVWYEGSTISNTTRRFLMADERGSIVSITDSAGATLHINAYDEYGIPAPGNLGRFGYTGQAWLPEVGMWYYKARIYSPTLGRFMQTDPIGYQDGMNWYAYVGGDPVNFGDSTGEFMTCTGSLFLHPDGFDCGGPGGPAFLYTNGVSAAAAYMSKELAARDALPSGTSTKLIRACVADPACMTAVFGGPLSDQGIFGGCGASGDAIVVCAGSQRGNQNLAPGGNPGDSHIVEYYVDRSAWFHIWLFHASPLADALGKSKFKDVDQLPLFMAYAFAKEGIHQPNGNTAYVYEHWGTVGTLPDGHTTHFFTVIGYHPLGSKIGRVVTAFPGLPSRYP